MIILENVVKSFPNGDSMIKALDGVNLKINNNDFLVILGPSGSGKSTLLNVISGLEEITTGTITYDREDIGKYNVKKLEEFRRSKIGFIFQAYFLLPTLTVEGNVRMGAALSGSKEVKNIIERVGLAEKSKKYPYQLSGGEQQRVAIARAIAKNPEVLFCDEPTGALDEETGKQILRLLVELNQSQNITIIMVTHNPAIGDISKHLISMRNGKIINESYGEPKNIDSIRW